MHTLESQEQQHVQQSNKNWGPRNLNWFIIINRFFFWDPRCTKNHKGNIIHNKETISLRPRYRNRIDLSWFKIIFIFLKIWDAQRTSWTCTHLNDKSKIMYNRKTRVIKVPEIWIDFSWFKINEFFLKIKMHKEPIEHAHIWVTRATACKTEQQPEICHD
jgi:hypothetical protein